LSQSQRRLQPLREGHAEALISHRTVSAAPYDSG
jgi:hypothetical protein